jgi:hypothetical protein
MPKDSRMGRRRRLAFIRLEITLVISVQAL